MRTIAPNAASFPDQVGGYAPREPAIFRYAVRTDRGGVKAIERLARASGVSPDMLVQTHFEQLLLAAAGAASVPAPAPAGATAARQLGVPPLCARVLVEMAKLRDEDDRAAVSSEDLAQTIGSSASTINGARSLLVTHRHLVLVQRGSWSAPAIYRIPPATLAIVEGAKA